MKGIHEKADWFGRGDPQAWVCGGGLDVIKVPSVRE